MYWNFNTPYNCSHQHLFDSIGETELTKHLSFVHEHTISPVVNTPEINAKKIWQCRQETNRLPVLTFDGNPYPDVKQYLIELNRYIDPDQYFVLASDSREDQSTANNLAPFSTWLLITQLSNRSATYQRRKYRISYLSGVARFHRIELFKKIKPYIQQNDIVVVNKFCAEHITSTIPKNIQIHDINDYLSELPWQSQLGLIDSDQNQTCATDQHSVRHPAYTACVNITGETQFNGDLVLVSEKTWKSYIAGCLTINFATDNFSAELEKLGIKIWDEYDKPRSLTGRTEKIIELFQRDDIEDLYRKNIDMVKYNQQLVTSVEFAKKLAEPALIKIKNML